MDLQESAKVHLLVQWLLSAAALWLVAQLIPGIYLRGFGSALFATIVIAIVNALIGWPLQILAFPFTILTLGLFWVLINAALLKLASLFSPGFKVDGFVPAIVGSVLLTVLHYVLTHMYFTHAGLLR